MKSLQMPKRYRKIKVHAYKNKVLEKADFSYADIRGVDFSQATLVNANFMHCKAGQPTAWVIGLGIIALLSMMAVGGILGFVSLGLGTLSLATEPAILVVIGAISLIVLSAMIGLVLWRGLDLFLIGSVGLLILISTLVIIPTNVDVGVQAFFLSFLIA
ncbi:MAG: pentapeptide repeat-containing protein, partial [Cyanobacteria bacterium P01_F01_bin.3]